MGESAKRQELESVHRFDRSLGTDELNFAEFPLAAIAHRLNPNQRTLTFEDEIFDEGNQQPVQRKLVISASEHFGLPTPLDSDVLLVLLYLTNARNGLTDRTVSFSRYELVKQLSWDAGGKSYRRLDEALNRWASVTLYYNHGWWDRSVRKWRSRTFHVLESLDLRGREGKGEDVLSNFTWNEVVFSSLQSNNIKRLNLEFYFSLKNAAARQAYRFLDKRFYRSRHLEFDLRNFACEHVGFSRSYDAAQLRRRLQPAIDELEAVGFLAPLSAEARYRKRGRGDWVISLDKAATPDSLAFRDEERSSPLAEKLVERGITTNVAVDIARSFSKEQVEEKIALHDWLVRRKDKRAAKNPAGFLAKAIRENYPLPKDCPVARLAESKERTAADKPSEKIVAVPPNASMSAVGPEIGRFEEFWAQLPETARAEFEAKALGASTLYMAETYERLREKGGPLFCEIRQTILLDHARSAGVLVTNRTAAA